MQVAQERDSIAGGAVPLTPVAGWCDFDAIIVAIWRWSLMLLLGASRRPCPRSVQTRVLQRHGLETFWKRLGETGRNQNLSKTACSSGLCG